MPNAVYVDCRVHSDQCGAWVGRTSYAIYTVVAPRASFAEGRACSPPHPCGTVRGARGASLAEGRARSPPARTRTAILNNPPGSVSPPLS